MLGTAEASTAAGGLMGVNRGRRGLRRPGRCLDGKGRGLGGPHRLRASIQRRAPPPSPSPSPSTPPPTPPVTDGGVYIPFTEDSSDQPLEKSSSQSSGVASLTFQQREREREKERETHTHTHTHTDADVLLYDVKGVRAARGRPAYHECVCPPQMGGGRGVSQPASQVWYLSLDSVKLFKAPRRQSSSKRIRAPYGVMEGK